MASLGLPMAKTLSPWRTVWASASARCGKFSPETYQGDVQVFVDVNHFAFQMLAVGQDGDERAFIAGDVGVGGDHAGLSDEQAAAGFLQPSQLDHRGFCQRDQRFQRKLRRQVCGPGRRVRRDAARKGCADRIEPYAEWVTEARAYSGLRSAGDTKFFGVRGACEKSKRD